MMALSNSLLRYVQRFDVPCPHIHVLWKFREHGQPGLNRGHLDLQSNALPPSYTPASANFCFVIRRNGYENALSRKLQNGTGPGCPLIQGRRGHKGLNRGPLDLQSNALPLSYTHCECEPLLCADLRRYY
ncbi:hypothetical protein TNCV_4035951 [Trichonephila clavipes]|nr:hypothetical protein TNCV_4035951 [Trichonephila clavipes]